MKIQNKRNTFSLLKEIIVNGYNKSILRAKIWMLASFVLIIPVIIYILLEWSINVDVRGWWLLSLVFVFIVAMLTNGILIIIQAVFFTNQSSLWILGYSVLFTLIRLFLMLVNPHDTTMICIGVYAIVILLHMLLSRMLNKNKGVN